MSNYALPPKQPLFEAGPVRSCKAALGCGSQLSQDTGGAPVILATDTICPQPKLILCETYSSNSIISRPEHIHVVRAVKQQSFAYEYCISCWWGGGGGKCPGARPAPPARTAIVCGALGHRLPRHYPYRNYPGFIPSQNATMLSSGQ